MLTDAYPIYRAIWGLDVWANWKVWVEYRLLEASATRLLTPSDFMDLPLEFQAGIMMAFCAAHGCPISIIVPEKPGEVWLADNGTECFAHEDQFTALRDCLADAFLIIDKKNAQP